MRVVAWVVGILVVVVLVGFAYLAATEPPAPVHDAGQAIHSPATPSTPQASQRGANRFNDSWHRHRDQFRSVSDYSARVRTNRIVAVLGFLLFVFLTLPRNSRGVQAFYRQMMETSPLPAASGASDDNNRRARRLLFFYLLFLLYQLVQFPLTWGRDNNVQFVSDLVIQAFLLVAVVWSYAQLKGGLGEQWGDSDRRNETLSGKLEGINIRWRDIRRMAVGVFIAGFAPALMARLTEWGDALAAFSQRIWAA